MTIPNLAEGDLCDITIRGARFYAAPDPEDDPGERYWTFAVGDGNGSELLSLNLDDPQYGVERVGPADWPPQAGDVWADVENEEWVAVQRYGGSTVEMHLMDSFEAPSSTPSEVLDKWAPLRLVRRREVS